MKKSIILMNEMRESRVMCQQLFGYIKHAQTVIVIFQNFFGIYFFLHFNRLESNE